MKAIKILFVVLLGLVLLWIAGQLFFEEKIESFLRSAGHELKTENAGETVRISTPFEFRPGNVSLEPNETAWPVFINIFDPLVRQDEHFRITPALALSWGKSTDESDDYTKYGDDIWEFRLRPNVNFHDGSRFDAEDVIATYEYAKTIRHGGNLDNILSTIESMEAIDDLTLRIRTHLGDPYLLERLSLMLIFPSEITHGKSVSPVGTGPFRVHEWDENGKKIILQKFPAYWGKQNNVHTVKINFMDGEYMGRAMEKQSSDIFLGYRFTPKSKTKPLYVLASTPGLRIFYFVFNFRSPFFENIDRRRAFSLAIDQQAVIDALEVRAQKASQFVAPGVFGFNPDIKPHGYDLDKAKELALESGMTKESMRFTVYDGLEELGQYLSKQMEMIGVKLELFPFSADGDNLGMSDLFFMTNENLIANSGYFLESSVKSRAIGNTGNYENSWADVLIDMSQVGGLASRQKDLFDAMKFIVEEDPLGIPLYVKENIIIHHSRLRLPYRLDGLLYFNNLAFP